MRSTGHRLRDASDLGLAAVLALAAALAFAFQPDGSPLRIALAAPALLLVPGYLLLQAVVVPAAPMRTRALHLLLSIGITPALVGLLALSTAIVPGGFRPAPIVAAVTCACVALAITAWYRRSSHATAELRASLPAAAPPSATKSMGLSVAGTDPEPDHLPAPAAQGK